jgi:hypothetical protein
MSIQSVKMILGQAVSEPEFRSLLFRNPGQALAGYELTEAETKSLQSLTPENFDQMSTELESRISRARLGALSASASASA